MIVQISEKTMRLSGDELVRAKMNSSDKQIP